MIPLSQGKFALVDDEDFEELSKHKWQPFKDHNTYYACRSIRVNGKMKSIRMHQQLLGKKDGYEIDHDDGNGLNNQRHNLKHVTHRKNMQNRHENTYSKYYGVTWDKNRNKWLAQIKTKGKNRFLGRYSDEHEAFLAYCNAEISLAHFPDQQFTRL